MANKEHLEILDQGVEAWNTWRAKNSKIEPDLSEAALSKVDLTGADLFEANLTGADLTEADLTEASLSRANLTEADLTEAHLTWANLTEANLTEANLSRAYLKGADLRQADLTEADLTEAKLSEANLSRADLSEADLNCADLIWANLSNADLKGATLRETILVKVDLSSTKGLDSCRHQGPSGVDHRTLSRSKNVPISFWRGCGLPDALIDYMPSLSGDAIQFYSCFISYSSKDQDFADRLHADLQNAGVRCWFAPHDLEIGAFTHKAIDEQIRFRDKVVLILSDASVRSAWVNHEVMAALKEEASGRQVLFPLRIDDAVFDTTKQWAHDIQENRNIGDFTLWKEHDAYQETFQRVLRDLTTST